MNQGNAFADGWIIDNAPAPRAIGSVFGGLIVRVSFCDLAYQSEKVVSAGPYAMDANASHHPFRSGGGCGDSETEPAQPVFATLDTDRFIGQVSLFNVQSISSREDDISNDCDGGDSRCNASDNPPEFRSRHQRVLLLSQGGERGEGVASTLHRTSEAIISSWKTQEARERVLAEGGGE